MMFGYASDETPEYMPYPIALAHKLSRKLTEVRKNGTLPYLRPDGKTQVTVEYDENGVPARLDAVVLSTQHDPEVTQDQIHKDIKKYVFDAIIPEGMVDEKTKFFINPTGRFVIGGPHGDSGLTGRKIIVDTYGGMARHGGGAFSGKDCTKVDRSAAYAARYVAKNIVAAGLAKKCEIQLSYAIGVAHPTSIMVDTFGTGAVEDDKLVEIVRENFDLRPAGIIQMLDLRRPIYKQTAAYGHFGRTDIDLPWEKLDKVEDLKNIYRNFIKVYGCFGVKHPFSCYNFFSGGQIHEAENAISYSIFTIIIIPVLMAAMMVSMVCHYQIGVVEKNYGITGTTISDFTNSMQVLARVTEKPYHELKDMSEQASEMEDATELDQFNKNWRIRMHTCW